MKTTTKKFFTFILLMSGMFSFLIVTAQNSCNGNKFLMSKGPGGGCGCHCQKKCVAAADTLTYLNKGYHFGNCWGNCCWIRSGEEIPSNETPLTEIYPNPVSSFTTISFSLSESQNVSLKIFDMNGRLVSTLADKIFEEGANELIWNAGDMNQGVYFLQYYSTENFETIKLIVTK